MFAAVAAMVSAVLWPAPSLKERFDRFMALAERGGGGCSMPGATMPP
jgi:hypothetical protein